MTQPNDILLPRDIQFELSYTLPQAYTGFVLRGASVFAASADAGNIIVQTFEQPLFTIRLIFFELLKPLTVTFKHPPARLESFLAIKNGLHYSLQTLGQLKLKQGQYTLLHRVSKNFKAHYQSGRKQQALHVSWSAEIVDETLNFFEVLSSLKHNTAKDDFFLAAPSRYAGHVLLQLAHEIVNCKMEESRAPLYFQSKVREYLLFLLSDISKKPVATIILTEEEWSMIDSIAAMLRREPKKKFPIVQLALMARMNTMKLKVAFKQRYGQGIFEYQLQGRLEEALRLLEETNLPVKEISSMVGYKLTTSFMTKFREYFGFYVTDVVRKNK